MQRRLRPDSGQPLRHSVVVPTGSQGRQGPGRVGARSGSGSGRCRVALASPPHRDLAHEDTSTGWRRSLYNAPRHEDHPNGALADHGRSRRRHQARIVLRKQSPQPIPSGPRPAVTPGTTEPVNTVAGTSCGPDQLRRQFQIDRIETRHRLSWRFARRPRAVGRHRVATRSMTHAASARGAHAGRSRDLLHTADRRANKCCLCAN